MVSGRTSEPSPHWLDPWQRLSVRLSAASRPDSPYFGISPGGTRIRGGMLPRPGDAGDAWGVWGAGIVGVGGGSGS